MGLALMHRQAKEQAASQNGELCCALQEIARASGVLSRALRDVQMLSWLEKEGPLYFDETDPDRRSTAIPDAGRFLALFGRIQERATQAARSIDVRRGRLLDRPGSAGGSTKAVCALMIREAWFVARGKAPGKRSELVAEAVGQFWTATGGDDFGRGGSAQSNWRGALQEADAFDHNEIEAVRAHFASVTATRHN